MQNLDPQKLQKDFGLMKWGHKCYQKMILHALYHMHVARNKREKPV